MIRPLTFLCLAAAFGSGLYLYQEKHSAIMVDREIARLIHGSQAARERTGLLRAEWALLNDPGRLQDMSEKYLQLKPMAPGQFVQLADLSTRLPPVPPPTPPGAPDDAATDASPAPAVSDAPMANAPLTDAPVAEAATPDAPAVVARAAEAPRPVPPKQVAHIAPKMPAHPMALADRTYHETPLAHGTPLPLAGMPPPRARVMSAMARPMRLTAAARPAVITAYPSAIGAGTYIGSALATGSSLPPPVPLR